NCMPVTARGYSAEEKRRAQAKHDQPAAAALGDEIAEQEDHAERDQSQGQERARKHRAAVVGVGLEVAAHWLRLRRSLARESCSEVTLPTASLRPRKVGSAFDPGQGRCAPDPDRDAATRSTLRRVDWATAANG